MRGSLRASDNARSRRATGTIAAVLAAFVTFGSSTVSCSPAPPQRVAPRSPPPRVLMVGTEQLVLRTSAWVELHAWLAANGRSPREVRDPEIESASRAYAATLAADDDDALLQRTSRALASCDDERCARAAVLGTPFAEPYLAALPGFLDRHWTERATSARQGVELARASLGDKISLALTAQLSKDLALEWPAARPVVDMVADAPEPGRAAPIRALLGAHASCLVQQGGDTERVHDARVIDCLLGYALIGMAERSAMSPPLHGHDARAWTALVIHAVATAVTAWEPHHVSALRRSAMAVMPETMEWLAREWPSRLRGEAAAAFAKRYAAEAFP